MASPNLSEIITTTLRNRTGKLADDVSKSRALFMRLSEKGKAKDVSGGRVIVQELEYAENGNFMYYSGYETLSIAQQDVMTAAEFDPKQAACAVTASGAELAMNNGKEQVIDLLESRIENAMKTIKNNIAIGCYAAGTGSGGKEIGGLQLLVADSPSSGTVGGINRATYSFWRNISFDATTDGGSAATSANIQSYMNRVYIQLCRGEDKPDLMPADNNYYRLYLESLQPLQRFSDDKLAGAGFQTLKFMNNADVVLDGGYGGGCPTNHMYFLNTDYIYLRTYKGRKFVVLDGDRTPTAQDAIVKIVAWMGNMTISNCFVQGVLKD